MELDLLLKPAAAFNAFYAIIEKGFRSIAWFLL